MCSESPVMTIAVIDLETNDLPSNQNNTCSITELSIYAFSSKYFATIDKDVPILKQNEEMGGIEKLNKRLPELPRILHKLTMLINPQRDIHPVSSKISGLSNAVLMNESPFDLNTANCLLSFLDRLEKPICLVAHNGWEFDYPIIRYVLAQVSMKMPSSIYCIDSFKALRELDEKAHLIRSKKLALTDVEPIDERSALEDYRKIFGTPFQPKEKYPKKGTYVLGKIFERLFEQSAGKMHCAELDVSVLTKIILSYGLAFHAYIEERKKSFDEVPLLG